MKKDLIELGHSGRPHGLKGEVALVLDNPESRLLQKGRVISLFPYNEKSSLPVNGQEFSLKRVSFGNKVIISLEGVENRNSLEEMIPFTLKESRDNFPEIEDGEFYTVDLVGCQVFADESEVLLGEVAEYYSNGVQDIFVIIGSGKYKGKRWEIPFIENFFKEVDIERKKVFVVLPELI